MSMLYITFMGGPRFLLDGADVSDQISSKAAAIVALVLMRATRQMRRSDIISYLWSESSDDAAKYNLRFNLWQIKKALVQADGESLLLVSKDVIKVNPNFSFLCDISEIEQAALEDINSIAELKHLLSLFRGDFFENCSLHNCENFLEYIIQRRYYLENRKLVVYHRLIHLTYENKLYDDCLQLLSACEEIDPYNEDIAQIRLEILLQRNARREAAQYYQMFYSRLLRDVGVEPSGEAFNSLVELDNRSNRPFNPMINSGAITVASLLVNQYSIEDMQKYMQEVCEDPEIAIDEAVFQSEMATCARNKAIAYLLKSKDIIDTDVEESVTFYTKMCSMSVNARDLARFGLLLANDGVQLSTGKRLISSQTVRMVQTIMLTCGMYDGSGEFALRTGIPTKSGVGGGLLSVSKKKMGIGIYGPSLDKKGNCIAGCELLGYISEALYLHIFDTREWKVEE